MTDDVKEIRRQLKKELGYNARMVSVRKSIWEVVFTIRDKMVNEDAVREFSTKFEYYRRDVATGEIHLQVLLDFTTIQ